VTRLLVPPIKCQGIKSKLVPTIRSLVPPLPNRWVEPFCGSCVVAFNVRPERAVLTDTNAHLIRFYTDLQRGSLTPDAVRDYLETHGARLAAGGESVYYDLRAAFNAEPTSLAFLFLNRACFNGVLRFNRKGGFNVPFCRKPQRFARAYVTKIVNQVRACANVLRDVDWCFQVADFRAALDAAQDGDFVYADPPYAGRHVDYYNTWSAADEESLAARLAALPCRFLLSTWHSNAFRANDLTRWSDPRYSVHTLEHFYHVGSTEELRHPMTEALVTNYPTSRTG
jgi:DNA adenine methylase